VGAQYDASFSWNLSALTITNAVDVVYAVVDEANTLVEADKSNNTRIVAVTALDSDSDGMPDWWEIAHGLNPNDPSDAAQDKDGDGVTNLAEYRAGTDPSDPISYLRVDLLNLGVTNGVQIVWGSASNRLYTLQRAGDVIAGGATFTNLAEHILSTPPQNVFLDPTATNGARLFYRLKAE
jgi:hypothetical protein